MFVLSALRAVGITQKSRPDHKRACGLKETMYITYYTCVN